MTAVTHSSSFPDLADSADAVLLGLDPEQREVATTLRGPVCVLAGAGTGKTRAITHRIAYGVRSGAFKPASVLAVTFTNRAAGEMRGRLRGLGAEGVQLGTRMVSAAESPVHGNWKQAILDADDTGTVMLNRHTSPALRALRTNRTEALEFDTTSNAMALFGTAMDLYFGGDMESAIALSGQVAGRIDEVLPVAEIIRACAEGCLETLSALADAYLGARRP